MQANKTSFFCSFRHSTECKRCHWLWTRNERSRKWVGPISWQSKSWRSLLLHIGTYFVLRIEFSQNTADSKEVSELELWFLFQLFVISIENRSFQLVLSTIRLYKFLVIVDLFWNSRRTEMNFFSNHYMKYHLCLKLNAIYQNL